MKRKIRCSSKLLQAILLMFTVVIFTTSSFAQNGNVVKGVVLSSSDREPLPGVTILVKGTTTGTSTNIDGTFTLTLPQKAATLVCSFVGFTSQEVVAEAGKPLTVYMTEETSDLEEVVVVGYGVQKKKLNTGATVQVKGDALMKQNTVNPLQAMQGQTPGVSISSTSGQPGSDMKVTIRGLGTVGNSNPLYLIDGVAGDIATLNPSDIESIDVLKDAASAAIYGAQAANGVVLITTKQGKEGKSQVTFDAYYGVQNLARKTDMLNAAEYKVIMDEQQLNSGSVAYDWDNIQSIYTYTKDADGNILSKTPIDTDWLDEMIADDTKTQSYTLGISGGSKTSTYAMSLGYLSQEGVVGGPDASNYDRYNFRINSEHKLFGDVLVVGEHVGFSWKEDNGIKVGNQYNNSLRGAFGTSPLAPVYDENGNYNNTSGSDWYDGDGNPYGLMMVEKNKHKEGILDANAYAQIEPIKNLKVKTVFGIRYKSRDERSYTPKYTFSKYSMSNVTKVIQSKNDEMAMTWTNTASYDWEIGEHAFNVLAGMEVYRLEGSSAYGENTDLKNGFDSWGSAWLSNTSGTDNKVVTGKPNDPERKISYFGRLGWNWKETYMLNATIRSDGSSKFAEGNRFGIFPSVSAGWTVSNEKWMSNTQSWMDFLKVRLSWGQVGNQNITAWQYLAPIRSTNTNYNFGNAGTTSAWIPGAYPSRLANEDITWETSEQTNFGIDARFLDSRLGVNADFYVKKTKDWLVEAPILATVGTGAPYINGGDVKNTGLELSLSWNGSVGKDFQYTVSVNGAYNKNEVGSIPTEDGMIHGNTGMLYDNSEEFYRASNGHAIGYFWGYKTAGLFQNQQEIDEWKAAGNGILQTNVKPGDVKYVDVKKDGAITSDDKVDLGNGMPTYTFGFNIGMSYKSFDFGVTANGAADFQIVQSYRNHTNTQSNYTSSILGRWTGEGTSNKIPRVTTTNINWQFSDLYIQDGDYLRISNITLGYDFAKLINCKYVSQCRFYAQVQNAFTFTKYDGMDPEIGYGPEDGNGSSNSWVSGVDLGYYPRPRTVLFGVNVKF